MGSLSGALADVAVDVGTIIEAVLPRPEGPERQLAAAMRHAVMAGGKRLRPFLLVSVADLFAVPRAASLQAAAAVEMVHTYSLVHDDLPCMDDDALRRGQPTVHVAFDEATAVLAGDALLTLAFQVLTDPEIDSDPAVRLELVRLLAEAAGAAGMCAGQMIDLQAADLPLDRSLIDRLQALKTGAMITVACEIGAVLGRAAGRERDAIRQFGAAFGRAFQIIDDLLDVEGSEQAVGKAVGKDCEAGKATLLRLMAPVAARAEAEQAIAEGLRNLDLFGERATLLRDAAAFAVHRQY